MIPEVLAWVGVRQVGASIGFTRESFIFTIVIMINGYDQMVRLQHASSLSHYAVIIEHSPRSSL